MEERKFASVSRVHARLRKLLEPALDSKAFWLRAELSSVRRSGGRLYCELVEMNQGKVVAKFQCTIWGRELEEIDKRLRKENLDELLADGNEVGLRCQIQYHQLYGMSVSAVDIDPTASLGALERKKQEIIKRLQVAQLLRRNAKCSVPRLPRRIGLVASHDTAGYKDFVATIASSGYGLQIFSADARVEGEDAEWTVLKALDALVRLEVDVVVVLRGGGSRLSLSYLDNEAIARAIALCPRPVWTAIGHEIDTSVLDAVAHTSFKTPTAVAEHLIALYAAAEEALKAAARALRNVVQMRLAPERTRMDGAGAQLLGLAKRGLRERRAVQESDAKSFRLLVQQRLSNEDARLSQARAELGSLAKQQVATSHRALQEHHKSLHKTIGRALDSRKAETLRLRKRLISPTAINRLQSEAQRCVAWTQVLRAADPARNLERGYALVYTPEGGLLQSTASVQKGQTLHTRFADGIVKSTVDSAEPGAGAA